MNVLTDGEIRDVLWSKLSVIPGPVQVEQHHHDHDDNNENYHQDDDDDDNDKNNLDDNDDVFSSFTCTTGDLQW